MTQYRLKKDTFGIPAGTIAGYNKQSQYYHLWHEKSSAFILISENTIKNGDEFEKVEELIEWENWFDVLTANASDDAIKAFIRSEFKKMGEEIMELSNNQTNRAFSDDVMQVMRERGAIK